MANRRLSFQILNALPIPLSHSQCVLYKHEILICGGYDQRACYSYHTLKDEYKFICEYPSDVSLSGHCVVKLVDNNNEDRNRITLLSFGGSTYQKKHTLVMKYIIMNAQLSLEEMKNDYRGARAVIGGINNHLLFITFKYNNISVFNLNTVQFIKHDKLPTNDFIQYHCFVSRSKNEQKQGMMKKNPKKNIKMLLFCKKTGLSIEYNENKNTFQFHKLPVCKDIAPFNLYAYVCINGIILFFGGYCSKSINEHIVSESVHKYLIKRKKWFKFKRNLPIPLYGCFGILNKDNTHAHIIGGRNYKKIRGSIHMEKKIRAYNPLPLVIFLLICF
ncbi:hypothetical protein RFI_32422 [Reticulomyxa filosa]|uniref:Kelch motif family protein n=1 Tax=Reticulomyxa filosa TaxID=46433 RepID=X6LV16_RETFI|nr:hypothetical protein RFI_32422 [Reticulomyxa filosa]|eukprot:ETO04977.1 hypothetical protein RFI_32422 [Reticulomyxa filosa]